MTNQNIYVMRMWHEQSDHDAWRVTITNTKTHEKLHFASLDKLVAFFKEELELDTEQATCTRAELKQLS